MKTLAAQRVPKPPKPAKPQPSVQEIKLARARARNAQTQDWMQAAMCAESI